MAEGLSVMEWIGLRDSRTRRLLENALHMPVWAIHGAADSTVTPQGDIWNHEGLDGLGYANEFHLVEGEDHILSFIRGQGSEYETFWTWLVALTAWKSRKTEQVCGHRGPKHGHGRRSRPTVTTSWTRAMLRALAFRDRVP